VTLVPWSAGKSLVWDFNCPNTLALLAIPKITFQARAATSAAGIRKRSKYAGISHAHIFIPVALETFGAWGQKTAELIKAIGRRMIVATQESRSTFFLRQRVDSFSEVRL